MLFQVASVSLLVEVEDRVVAGIKQEKKQEQKQEKDQDQKYEQEHKQEQEQEQNYLEECFSF